MEVFNPSALKQAEKALPGMCPKAYRWVHEMEEIQRTFGEEGGFEGGEEILRGLRGSLGWLLRGLFWGRRRWGGG